MAREGVAAVERTRINELSSPCSPCPLCSPTASGPFTPCAMLTGGSPATPDAAAAAAAPGLRRGGRPDRVLGVFSRMASLTWLRLKPVIWQIRALGSPASKKSVRARRRSASVRCFVPMTEGPGGSKTVGEKAREVKGSRRGRCVAAR